MNILFNQTWILFIIITFINGLILKARSKEYIAKNPALEEGYKKLFRNWIFYGNIPWLIMGIGNLSGLTHSSFEYFAPRLMNPIVLVFHASVVVLWILSIRWIYFKNGAEFLEQHPGLLRSDVSAKRLKLVFPLMLLGGIAAMIFMWTMNISVPVFR